MEEALKRAMAPLIHRIDELGSAVQAAAGGAPAAATAVAAVPPRPVVGLHMWGGKMRRVPESFQLPQGGLLPAFLQWHIGDPVKGYPPLRYLDPCDVGDEKDPVGLNKQKRLADLQKIMKMMEDEVKKKNKWVESPTLSQANEMFSVALPALGIPQTTPKGRKRRMDQLAWTTFVRDLNRK